MNQEQLQHVLRAASRIVAGSAPVVIGSQAVLGSRREDELPVEATRSIEADIAFFDDHDDTKADAIDGAIGELSMFHESFGYYAQGVSITTAVSPAGWQDRLVKVDIHGEPMVAYCLEPHDCVISKLVADRQKDREFAAALIRARIVDSATLEERVRGLPSGVGEARRGAIIEWIRRQQVGDHWPAND